MDHDELAPTGWPFYGRVWNLAARILVLSLLFVVLYA